MTRPLPASLAVVVGIALVGHAGLGWARAESRGSTGELRIRKRTTTGRGLYIEGSVQFVRVRRARDHRLVLTRRLHGARIVRARLRPGYYALASFTRTCDANCGTLDPPSFRCRGAVRIRRGRHVTLTVHDRPGARCRVTNP